MTASLAQFRFTPLLVCGLAVLCVSLTSANAFAATKADVPSVKVKYDRRDLATPEGTEKVYGKIKKAAHRVCFMSMETSDPRRTRHYWECYAAALNKAVDDVNSNNLTALHQQDARTKRPG